MLTILSDPMIPINRRLCAAWVDQHIRYFLHYTVTLQPPRAHYGKTTKTVTHNISVIECQKYSDNRYSAAIVKTMTSIDPELWAV